MVTLCGILAEEEANANFQRGFENGVEKGTIRTLINLVKNKKLTIKDAAEEANLTVSQFKRKFAALA